MAPERPPRPPRQARSRASERRLLGAARAILARRGYDQVSVAEIAQRAGLTVGGFYSRFPSKSALFDRLERAVFEETRAMAARIDALARRGAEPHELLAALVTQHVRLYRRNRAVVRALLVRARSEPALSEEIRELARENYALVVAALEASGRVRRDDARRALEFALYAERSVLREAVIFGEGWAKERRWSDERIVIETVRLLTSYLGLAPPEPAASSAAPAESSRPNRTEPTNRTPPRSPR